jgi:hypothetical protein
MRDSKQSATRERRHAAWRFICDLTALLVASAAIVAVWRDHMPKGSTSWPEPGHGPGESLSYPVPLPHTPKSEMIVPAAAHEGADVGRRFIGGAFALLFGSLAIITLCVLWLFPMPRTDRTLSTPLRLYSEPRLQTSSREDMQRFRNEEMGELTTYGWVDKAHGVAHLPIDIAMDKIAQRGITDWPTSPKQAKVQPAPHPSPDAAMGAGP